MDSFDPDDPLETERAHLLSLILNAAGAKRGALFVPRGDGLVFVVQRHLHQPGLDLAYACWARRRDDLKAGRIVRYGRTLAWPQFIGPELVGFIYIDQAREDFVPETMTEQDALRLVRCLPRVVSPAASYVAAGLSFADATDEFEADQLAMALESTGGNVTATAGLLKVNRETVYARAEEYNIDIDLIRERRKRKKAS